MGATVWAGTGVALPANIYVVLDRIIATAGQTVVPITLFTYTVGGNNIRVYINGLLQSLTVDYTETSTSSITFTSGLSVGDEVEVIGNNAIATSDAALRGDLASYTGSGLIGFQSAGTSAVSRLVRDKLRESVSVADFGAVAGGDIAAAINLAIAAGAAIIHIPAGLWTLATPLVLDAAIRIEGAGASNANGAYGATSTRILYSGTGVAITLDGTGANGKQNIHLSNFILTGTSAATGGILVGVTTNVNTCSIKNVEVELFTKVNAYGLCFQQCYLSTFEQVLARENYNGFLIGVTGHSNTTLTFTDCQARSNYHLGWNIKQLTNGLFNQCLAESNDNNGLAIQANGATDVVDALTFYNWHSEANLGNSHGYGTLGNATIYITGGATRIRMLGGYVSDLVAGVKAFDLDNVQVSYFGGMSLAGGAENPGFMTVSVNTISCVYEALDPTVTTAYITGYASGRIRLLLSRSGTYTPTLYNTTNIAASTARLCTYVRVDDMVTVSGLFDVTPTAGAPTVSLLGMSLPVASAFTSGFELGGTGCTDITASNPMNIAADSVNDRASINWRASSTAAQTCSFQFSYRIV